MGFEITKPRLKSIVDKIDYYIEKNNKLVNKDFSSNLAVDQNRIVKRRSYSDFIEIDTFESEFFLRLSITLSYLVDFGVEGGPSQPEKQVLVLRFDTTSPADVDIEIRSTEFTWPDAVFRLVEKELDDVANELEEFHPISQSIIFAPARIFSKGEFYIGKYIAYILVGIIAASGYSNIQRIISNNYQGSKSVEYIYDFDNKEFPEIVPGEYLIADDWQEKLSLVRDSRELQSYLGIEFSEGETLVFNVKRAVNRLLSLPAWLYTLAFVLSVFIWLNFREAARIRESRVGRIWLSSRKPPARQGVAASEGVLSGLILGVAGSAICAAIIAGIDSLVK